jgi:hypothetical protein
MCRACWSACSVTSNSSKLVPLLLSPLLSILYLTFYLFFLYFYFLFIPFPFLGEAERRKKDVDNKLAIYQCGRFRSLRQREELTHSRG